MKVRRIPLCAVLLLLAAGQAHAADVGRVLLAAGNVVAVREGQTVRLERGFAVQDRDLLRTGAASNLQVRFIDESIISLRENTEFRIDEFRFAGKEDGTERAFFRLLKGGLRAISGLVGRTNHRSFALSTNVSTIGIRGTDFATRLCQQDCFKSDGTREKDGQFGSVLGPSTGTNQINVSNERDQNGATFGQNQHFYVADRNSTPQALLTPPDVVSNRLESRGKSVARGEATGNERAASGGVTQDSRGATEPPAPPAPLTFVAVENRDATGGATVLGGATGTPTIAGLGAFTETAFAGNPSDGGGFFAVSGLVTEPAGAAADLATQQKLLAFSIPAGFSAESGGGQTAVKGDSGGTGFVIDETQPNGLDAHWGRWMGGTLVTNAGTTVNPPGGFHYLYGPLTPPEVIGAKTGSFTLSDTGFGTTPTNSLGETGTMAFSSATTVDFTTRMVNFGGVNMSFPSNSWGFSGGNTPIVIVPGKGAFVDQVTTGFCSGGACATSLPAVLGKTGIFMGPNGDHLGLALQARTTSGADVSAQGTKILTCSPSC